ncbi:MAG: tripartite motif-containing protein 71 [Acidobacteriota bacterium]|jgi:streptogramin lyase|nr:tripartite motif-containing protein 71 [Acidobacteriota bacterium]
MKLNPPRPPRSKTSPSSRRSRRRGWLTLFLALLLSSLLILAVSVSANYNFLTKWNANTSTSGQFITPRGIAVDTSGNVYVTDQNNRVTKFDSSGAFILQFGVPGSANGGFVSPFKVATDLAGNVYVTDSSEPAHGLQKFTSTGTWQFSIGGFLNSALGVAVDSSGNIYVGDQGNHRIRKFDSSGAPVTTWGSLGTGNTQFDTPMGVAVDTSNNVYVVDSANNRVQKFTSSGAYITQWGTTGSGNGQFTSPQGIAVDLSGNVYVADTGNNRIQKFDSSGAFIESFGTAGSGNGEFSSPGDVAVDSAGNVYVADSGNDRVQKFGTAAASPVADAGTDQTPECAGATTSITLNGTGSTPGSGTINSYTWKEGATTLGTGATLIVSLPSGSHNITLTVTNTGGGSNSDDVSVNIVDTTPPVINLAGDNPMTVECHTSFSDPGATATDSCAGIVPVTPSGSVNVDVPGPYTITYSATDGAHMVTATRTVNVVDATAPVITCPANVAVTLPPNSIATSMAVSYPAVTATDSCSASVTVNSSPTSGSIFPVGTTTVNSTASDGTNTSTCSFTVTVLYSFTGFFQPIDNLPALNSENAGRAIPVKFSLGGNKGLNIFAPGFPASGQIACGSSGPPVTLQSTVTSGGSGLNFGGDQYNYVWKTDPAWAGTCRQLVVQLKDGSIHRANFKFK